MNEWISAKDRLPDETGYYLYYCENNEYCGLRSGIGVSYFHHKAKNWKAVNNDYVTHWMPLPEPPEKEKENDEERRIKALPVLRRRSNRSMEQKGK